MHGFDNNEKNNWQKPHSQILVTLVYLIIMNLMRINIRTNLCEHKSRYLSVNAFPEFT